MNQVFLDTFTGSAAALSTHSPEIPASSTKWTGNAVISLNGSGKVSWSSNGYAAGYNLTDNEIIATIFSGTIAFTTPSSIVSGNPYNSIGAGFVIGGVTLDFGVELDGTGNNPKLNVTGGTSVAVSFAPSTTYNMTFAFNTDTKTSNVAISALSLNVNGTFYDTADETGMAYVTLNSRVGYLIDSIDINANTAILGEHATVSIRSPAPTLTIKGGGAAKVKAPMPTLVANGYDSAMERYAALTAPSPTLVIRTGANASLTAPIQTLSTSGTVTALATAILIAPRSTLSATVTASATAQIRLTSPAPTLKIFAGVLVSITTPLGTLQATGTTGSIGGAQLSCPLFELIAGGTAQNHGSSLLTAPMGVLSGGAVAYLLAPGARLTAIGTAVVSVTYEAYSVNLSHKNPEANDEVTHYTNFPFDRIVRYKNSYFGVNGTGLYLLEGTTDDAEPIPYEVKTHVTDFDATEQKTVVSAYMGGRMGAAETVTLFAGEKTMNAYQHTTPRGATPQSYRQKFGRGIKARYYGIGLKGDKEFDLDTLELEINKLPRRI